MEKKIKLKVYKIIKECPECKKGSMLSSQKAGPFTHLNPYDHRCDQCGHPETYHKAYPEIKYEEYE